MRKSKTVRNAKFNALVLESWLRLWSGLAVLVTLHSAWMHWRGRPRIVLS